MDVIKHFNFDYSSEQNYCSVIAIEDWLINRQFGHLKSSNALCVILALFQGFLRLEGCRYERHNIF